MVKHITIKISDNLHKEFKVFCAKKAIKMNFALELAMKILLKKKNVNVGKT